MTEGIAVVIILLCVPPGPPSSRFSAALPKPCRREKAQRGMSVARLSPISQSENNDWLFLWASLEKNPTVGWDGGEIFGQWIKFQQSSGIYIDCDPFYRSSQSPRNSEVRDNDARKDSVGTKPWLSKTRALKIHLCD